MSFNYVVGDVIKVGFDSDNNFDAVCCTTNMVVKSDGGLVMGRGVALAFNKHQPSLSYIWGERIALGYRNVLVDGHSYMGDDARYYPAIVAFPTKYHWQNPSDIDLIDKSAWELDTVANALGWKKILLPRPGCANGGLQWEDVLPILETSLTRHERYWIIGE